MLGEDLLGAIKIPMECMVINEKADPINKSGRIPCSQTTSTVQEKLTWQ